MSFYCFFFFSSRRRHTRYWRDWSSDVCSSDLTIMIANIQRLLRVFAVEPVPFHPDRCSGFAPIGSYATNIVRVALIVGSWALVLMLSGPLTGHGIYVAPHILFLVAVQVLL